LSKALYALLCLFEPRIDFYCRLFVHFWANDDAVKTGTSSAKHSRVLRQSAEGLEEPIVFVVDDDPSIRDALCNLIRSVGLRVEPFGPAPELLESELPDVASCLVLGIRLPRLGFTDRAC
jgi:hypothetical protein